MRNKSAKAKSTFIDTAISKVIEKELRDKGLKRRPEFCLPDEKFDLLERVILASGKVEELKRRLERLIFNYSARRADFKESIPKREVVENLRAVATAATRLANCRPEDRQAKSSKLDGCLARREVMPRLAGLYLFTSDEPLGRLKAQDIRQFKERFLQEPELTRRLAQGCLRRGAGTRNKSWPSLPTTNPPELDFMGELLRFWHFYLGREITSTGNDDDGSASPAVWFVRRCFELAGETCTLGQIRKRIKKALKEMDRHDPQRTEVDWAVEPKLNDRNG